MSIEKINGTILNPDEQFSFNQVVGERSVEKGFKEAIVILNGEYDKGIGGGICQTSSTLYNAVYIAQLQVDERHVHTKKVSYVERDASVAWGYKDFKFTNDLTYPIKIKAELDTTTNQVNVSIVGLIKTDNY